MAQIDVSELLSDPDFTDLICVVKTQQFAQQNGRALNIETKAPGIVAVVQPASGLAMNMLPQGVRLEGAIQVWTRYALQQPSPTAAADEILWQGFRYVVQTSNEWGNWGSGYIMAVCSLKSLEAE